MSQNQKLFFNIALLAATQVALFYGAKYLVTSLDPNSKKKEEARLKSSEAMKRLGIHTELSEHEQIIAGEIVWSEDLNVEFGDIGGLDDILNSLKETCIYPLIYPELFQSVSNILGPPKGVLLHGPPGCGKTMTAKALAKESGATFINLHVSTMTDKWFGESQKLVNALFSLAKKLQPTIIFIDEIDSFLRERKSQDHEATSMMKAEFMTLWDGLNTGNNRIIILGATNRPNDIDKAILRRMPKRFAINLPAQDQRKRVLELILKKIHLESKFDMEYLSMITEGYSNRFDSLLDFAHFLSLNISDLKELCRNAVMVPVREAIKTVSAKELKEKGSLGKVDVKTLKIRRVAMSDFRQHIDNDVDDTTAQSDLPFFPVD